jgi:hypothetical protein
MPLQKDLVELLRIGFVSISNTGSNKERGMRTPHCFILKHKLLGARIHSPEREMSIATPFHH